MIKLLSYLSYFDIMSLIIPVYKFIYCTDFNIINLTNFTQAKPNHSVD